MHLTPRGARLFLCAHAFVEDFAHTDPADLTDFFVGGKSHRGLWWGGSHGSRGSHWFRCGWKISQRLVEWLAVWVVRLLWVLWVLWVLRVLRVLHLLLLPRLNSYSWDLWDSWFSISHKFAQIFTNYFSLWFFIYLCLEQKNRVHWLVHPMILER